MKPIAAILIFAAALSGCAMFSSDDDGTNKFTKCADVLLLQPARAWQGPPNDDWTTRGQINEFSAACKITKTTADMTIIAHVHMERRGDTKEAQAIFFPFAVAVMRDDDILSKQVLNVLLKFGEGKTAVDQTVELPVSLDLIKLPQSQPDPAAAADKDKKDKDKKPKDITTAADRKIIFAFQLTPDQVAYFKKLRDDAGKFPKP